MGSKVGPGFQHKLDSKSIKFQSEIGQISIQNRSEIDPKSSKLGPGGPLGASWAHLGAQGGGPKVDFGAILAPLLGSLWCHCSNEILIIFDICFGIDF